jgi:hypothetical protein
MNDHDTNTAVLKIIIAWVGTAVGGVSLSGLVLTATLIFTVLQIYVLVRKIIKGQA